MAKIKFNALVEEVSGQFGDIVFRQAKRTKKIVLARKPRGGNEPTENQAAHQERFMDAVAYGKIVMADAPVRALYAQAAKEKDTPIFALTVADFLNAPEIKDVDLSTYHGQVNDIIKIKASDDFGIATMTVAITDSQTNFAFDGGNAVETAAGSGLWLFTATAAIPEGTNLQIKVVATDRPGGTAVNTQTKAI